MEMEKESKLEIAKGEQELKKMNMEQMRTNENNRFAEVMKKLENEQKRNDDIHNLERQKEQNNYNIQIKELENNITQQKFENDMNFEKMKNEHEDKKAENERMMIKLQEEMKQKELSGQKELKEMDLKELEIKKKYEKEALEKENERKEKLDKVQKAHEIQMKTLENEGLQKLKELELKGQKDLNEINLIGKVLDNTKLDNNQSFNLLNSLVGNRIKTPNQFNPNLMNQGQCNPMPQQFINQYENYGNPQMNMYNGYNQRMSTPMPNYGNPNFYGQHNNNPYGYYNPNMNNAPQMNENQYMYNKPQLNNFENSQQFNTQCPPPQKLYNSMEIRNPIENCQNRQGNNISGYYPPNNCY